MLYTYQVPVVPFPALALAQKLRLSGLIPHEGIVYRLNWNFVTQRWEITIAHLSKGGGLCLSSLEEFADGNRIIIIGSPSSPVHEAVIIQNINSALRWQAMYGHVPYDWNA
jgi:hypothetical protein